MDESSARLHAIVSGRVQGVNYRYSTLQRAQSLRLTGWVRNLPDGAVEVVAEGPQSALTQLLEFLHRGPPHAQVQSVQVGWQPAARELTHFDVYV